MQIIIIHLEIPFYVILFFFQPVLKRLKLVREQRVLEVIGGPEGTKMYYGVYEKEVEMVISSLWYTCDLLIFIKLL